MQSSDTGCTAEACLSWYQPRCYRCGRTGTSSREWSNAVGDGVWNITSKELLPYPRNGTTRLRNDDPHRYICKYCRSNLGASGRVASDIDATVDNDIAIDDDEASSLELEAKIFSSFFNALQQQNSDMDLRVLLFACPWVLQGTQFDFSEMRVPVFGWNSTRKMYTLSQGTVRMPRPTDWQSINSIARDAIIQLNAGIALRINADEAVDAPVAPTKAETLEIQQQYAKGLHYARTPKLMLLRMLENFWGGTRGLAEPMLHTNRLLRQSLRPLSDAELKDSGVPPRVTLNPRLIVQDKQPFVTVISCGGSVPERMAGFSVASILEDTSGISNQPLFADLLGVNTDVNVGEKLQLQGAVDLPFRGRPPENNRSGRLLGLYINIMYAPGESIRKVTLQHLLTYWIKNTPLAITHIFIEVDPHDMDMIDALSSTGFHLHGQTSLSDYMARNKAFINVSKGNAESLMRQTWVYISDYRRLVTRSDGSGLVTNGDSV